MKMLTMFFVLIFGLTAIAAKAQEPTPTPTTNLAVFDLHPTRNVRLNSGSNVEYWLFISQDSYTISADDVIVTAKLPSNVTYVSATSIGTCSYADEIISCNLGKLTKYYADYTTIVKIYARPTAAGAATLTGTIKGSNTPESRFSQTKIVDPPKSRVRFF